MISKQQLIADSQFHTGSATGLIKSSDTQTCADYYAADWWEHRKPHWAINQSKVSVQVFPKRYKTISDFIAFIDKKVYECSMSLVVVNGKKELLNCTGLRIRDTFSSFSNSFKAYWRD